MRVVKHTLSLAVCYVHIHADAHQQYTHPHVYKQTHLSPLHNAIGWFCSLFPHGIAADALLCPLHLLEKQMRNYMSQFCMKAHTHTHINNTILPVVFSIDDSDSSPHQQCVYGVGEN